MRTEYRAIVEAGFLLQIDAPDLGSARNNQYRHLSDAEFRKIAERNIAALNAATEGLPARPHAAAHLLGQLSRAAHVTTFRSRRSSTSRSRRGRRRSAIEAANPRHDHEWEDLQDIAIPDDKILIPGLIDSTSNFVEHPKLVAQRIGRYADIVGRERVIAGRRLRLRHRGAQRSDGGGQHRVGEAFRAARGRGHREQAAVGLVSVAKRGYLIALGALIISGSSAVAADIHVMTGGAPKEVLTELTPEFEKQTGHKVHFTYIVITAMQQKLAAGEKPDMVLMPAPALAAQVEGRRHARCAAARSRHRPRRRRGARGRGEAGHFHARQFQEGDARARSRWCTPIRPRRRAARIWRRCGSGSASRTP